MTQMITVNINHDVKVKLTERGRTIYRSTYGKDAKVDDEGYYTTQLHHLMYVFGRYLDIGAEIPFEMNLIVLKEK